jgi:hypothetical protein
MLLNDSVGPVIFVLELSSLRSISRLKFARFQVKSLGHEMHMERFSQ